MITAQEAKKIADNYKSEETVECGVTIESVTIESIEDDIKKAASEGKYTIEICGATPEILIRLRESGYFLGWVSSDGKFRNFISWGKSENE